MNTFLHPPGGVGVIPSHSHESLPDMREDIQAAVMRLIAGGLLIPDKVINVFETGVHNEYFFDGYSCLTIYLLLKPFLDAENNNFESRIYISKTGEKLSSHEFAERYLTSDYQNEVNTEKQDKMLAARARELGFLCLTDVATLFCRRVDTMLTGVL